MGMLTESVPFEGGAAIPARNAAAFVHRLSEAAGVPDRLLAAAALMPEAQLNRLASGRGGPVRPSTLLPLKRVAMLVEEAHETLAPQGARAWLVAPNPYLHNVAPVLCVRSDKELERARAVLAAIRHGCPA